MKPHATPLAARGPQLSRREQRENQRTAHETATVSDVTGQGEGTAAPDGFERDFSAQLHAARCRNLIGASTPGRAPMRAQAGAPERDLSSTVPEDLMGQVLAGLAGASSLAARRKKAS